MSKELIIIIGIAFYIITVTSIIVVLTIINNRDKKKYRKELDELQRDKNLIISANLIAELKKVEPLAMNANMKTTYEEWQKKFNTLKNEDVNNITDKLVLLLQ